MTEPNVYRRAADLIRIGGLAKGALERHDGSHCTIGAVRLAKYGNAYTSSGCDEEIILLADLLGGPVICGCGCGNDDHFAVVADWSDAADRTPEDVVGLLEQAAEKKEAEQ